MKIAIELDEILYGEFLMYGIVGLNVDNQIEISKAIRKGTPLPKNHGDLVDRNSLDFTDIDFYDPHCVYDVQNVVDNAPTIIEAEGSDNE